MKHAAAWDIASTSRGRGTCHAWEASSGFITGAAGATHRMCANRVEHAACNWMVPADDPLPFCRSCRLNRTIPNLLEPGSREAWQRIESAKRRFVRTLIDLRLPLESKTENPGEGIAFDFLRDSWGAPSVMTGHDNGLITINLGETGSIERARVRFEMDERYRTFVRPLPP